jgi:penicillin amidase
MGLVCVLALGTVAAVGCSESTQEEPDLEWPPNATAYFDEYGILNADCATDEDCAMVLGYYHAFDRFVQMDFRRRFATGRLTDIMDKAVAQIFVAETAARNRALFSTRDGEPLEEFVLEQASDKTVAMLEAYSAGVNRWIDDVRHGRNDAVFPREFSQFPFTYAPEDVPEWTPTDSMAAVMAAIDRESNLEYVDVANGAAREAIEDDDRFYDLWATRPLESSILPPGWTPPEPESKRVTALQQQSWRSALNAGPALRHLQARLEQEGELERSILGAASQGGSNNWVIAPSKSMTGNALLAQDGHLAMRQPTELYFAHLDARTNGRGQLHVAGGTSAALPSVIIGHNENIAWASTRTFLDLNDVYVEQLVKDTDGNPMGVMFQGEVVPFTRVPFTMRFNDGSSEEVELLFVPHHGPVREIDVGNNVALTLRWTGNDMDTDIEYLGALSAAASVTEARAALENITTRGGNFVVVDTEGNVGWFPYNRVPKRTWATDFLGEAHPKLPLDGRCSTPERCYEWTEYFDYAELPQAFNPEEGFIVTANNDMTGHLADGDPTNDGYAPLQTFVVPGFRHARITELIKEIGSVHTTDTMYQIQHDVYSFLGELMRPTFIEIAESEMSTLTEPGEKILNALKAWDLTCPSGVNGYYVDSPPADDPKELLEASGCAAFHAAYAKCDLTLRHEDGPRYYWMYLWTFLDPDRFLKGDVYWDDPATPETETKYQVISECFDEAGKLLINDLGLGNDETKWAWGTIHGLVLNSDLSSFGIQSYNNPPPGQPFFTNEGGRVTVSATDPVLESSGFMQSIGSVDRFVCEALPSGPACTIEMPGGQSSHIDSEHYDDLLFKYLDGEPIDLVFDINEAKANAVRTVTFE